MPQSNLTQPWLDQPDLDNELSSIETTVAGDGEGIPESTEDVIEVEGAAQQTNNNQQPTITRWLFQPDAAPTHFDLTDLPDIVSADENFAWVDLSEYVEHDIQQIAELLDIHPLAVRTTLGAWQRPRLDRFGTTFFVTVTVAHVDAKAYRVQASELDLFVGHNFLVSAHKQPLPFIQRVTTRARQSPELVELDSAFMLYILLDELIEYYEGLSEHIEDEIELMEERALADTSDDFLEDLLHLKRYIFALSRLADQHRKIFAAFLRPDFPLVSGDKVEPYYRDLEERLGQLLDTLFAAKDAVNGAFDIYVSHVSHYTNQVMKLLTIVSTVLLPTTVILGFFGTSFDGLPFYNTSGFIAMMIIIVLVTGVILFAFRRRGWL